MMDMGWATVSYLRYVQLMDFSMFYIRSLHLLLYMFECCSIWTNIYAVHDQENEYQLKKKQKKQREERSTIMNTNLLNHIHFHVLYAQEMLWSVWLYLCPFVIFYVIVGIIILLKVKIKRADGSPLLGVMETLQSSYLIREMLFIVHSCLVSPMAARGLCLTSLRMMYTV